MATYVTRKGNNSKSQAEYKTSGANELKEEAEPDRAQIRYLITWMALTCPKAYQQSIKEIEGTNQTKTPDLTQTNQLIRCMGTREEILPEAWRKA